MNQSPFVHRTKDLPENRDAIFYLAASTLKQHLDHSTMDKNKKKVLSRWALSWTSRKVKRCLLLALFATLLAKFFETLGFYESSQSISGQETSKFDLQSFGKIDAICRRRMRDKSRTNFNDDLKSLWNDMIAKPVDGTKQLRLTNFIPRKDEVPCNDVVLATHISAERSHVLLAQARYWGGPISAAVYINGYEQINIFHQFYAENADQLRNTTFHFLLEDTTEPYAHNILRNLALMNIESDYFFATDADHIPSPNAHDRLYNLLLTNHEFKSILCSKTLFVFPAFDVFPRKSKSRASHDMLPRSKDELLYKVKRKEIAPFHAICVGCHGPTNFEKWYNYTAGDFYPITNTTWQFEPYVMGYRHGMPQYWEDFRGFGKNLLSWFVELSAAGYEYAVLRDFWVGHLVHPFNLFKEEAGRERNAPHWEAFKNHIQDVYGIAVQDGH